MSTLGSFSEISSLNARGRSESAIVRSSSVIDAVRGSDMINFKPLEVQRTDPLLAVQNILALSYQNWFAFIAT